MLNDKNINAFVPTSSPAPSSSTPRCAKRSSCCSRKVAPNAESSQALSLSLSLSVCVCVCVCPSLSLSLSPRLFADTHILGDDTLRQQIMASSWTMGKGNIRHTEKGMPVARP